MPNRPELIAKGVALRKPRRALSVVDSASVDGPRSTMLLAFFMSPQHVDLAGCSIATEAVLQKFDFIRHRRYRQPAVSSQIIFAHLEGARQTRTSPMGEE